MQDNIRPKLNFNVFLVVSDTSSNPDLQESYMHIRVLILIIYKRMLQYCIISTCKSTVVSNEKKYI